MNVSIDPHRPVVMLAMKDRFSAPPVKALNEFVAAERSLANSHIRPTPDPQSETSGRLLTA